MDHKLIRAIGSVTCVMLLVKVLAMIKNILQARVYGAGVDADVCSPWPVAIRFPSLPQ